MRTAEGEYASYRGVPFGLATAPLLWGRSAAWLGRATQAITGPVGGADADLCRRSHHHAEWKPAPSQPPHCQDPNVVERLWSASGPPQGIQRARSQMDRGSIPGIPRGGGGSNRQGQDRQAAEGHPARAGASRAGIQHQKLSWGAKLGGRNRSLCTPVCQHDLGRHLRNGQAAALVQQGAEKASKRSLRQDGQTAF